MGERVLVSVVMITYGHEKYIRQAIEGVLMQEGDFDLELVIANDCSPDNTDLIIKDIIQNHPRGNWIKYHPHEKNLGMMPNFIFALQQAKGKYIALCDGDDYWLVNDKLQKQIEFLENNSKVVACFHNVYFVSNGSITGAYYQTRKNGVLSIEEAIVKGGGVYPTSSFVYRNNIELPLFVENVRAGDTCLLFSLLDKGDVYYFDNIFSIYRRHDGGVYTGIIGDKKLIFEDIKSNFYILYNYMKLYPKYKKEFKLGLQYQLERVSNRFRWYEALVLLINRNVMPVDFFMFYFKKYFK